MPHNVKIISIDNRTVQIKCTCGDSITVGDDRPVKLIALFVYDHINR